MLPNVYVYSLDVILTKSRMQIQCNIITQDENTVTYRLADSQDKEQYTMEKADIEKIYLHIDDTRDKTKVEPQKSAEQAHDVIVLKDGTHLDVLLVEVADKQVKYRKVNNPEGPLFVKEIANITSIIYANGEKEDFTKESLEIVEELGKKANTNSTPELNAQSANKAVQKNQTNDSENGFVYISENSEIKIIYNLDEKTIHIYADKPLMYHSKDVRNITLTTWRWGEKESYVIFDMINKLEGVALLSGLNAFLGNISFHKHFKKKMPRTFMIEIPYETSVGTYKMQMSY